MFVSLDLAESLIGRHIWYAVPFAMVRGARKVFRPAGGTVAGLCHRMSLQQWRTADSSAQGLLSGSH
jgi:hypothetical protein